MNKLVAGLAVAAALMNSIAMAEAPKPTIVLVHGAFADTSSWNAVIRILDEDGYPVVAAANPMRSVHGMRSTLMRFCPASNPQSSWSVIPMAASLSSISGGGKDLYIEQDKFPAQFAADVVQADARVLAETQRAITAAALNEQAKHPAWKNLPTWFVYGDQDKNILPQAFAFMAERAGARETVVVQGASHVVMVSNPKIVAQLIERAAAAIE